jgi:ornithine cyclodeaminase
LAVDDALTPGAGGIAGPLRYVDAAAVGRALADLDVVATVREVLLAHRAGETVLPREAYLPWRAPDGSPARSICLPARVPSAVGVKVINANPANPDRGLDRASGLVVLFDEQTAAPTVVLAAAPISGARTAAVSALAVELFAPEPARLAVIGCGALGLAHLRLLARALPRPARLAVFDRVAARAERAAATWPGEAAVAPDARAAAGAADVVVLTTTAPAPYVPWAWVREARLVLNVSLGDLEDEVFLRAAQVVVDDLDMVLADERRPLGRLLRAGRLGRPGDPPPSVAGALGDVLDGTLRPAEGTVVVNPFGLGICDVAVAAAVAARAGAASDVHLVPR